MNKRLYFVLILALFLWLHSLSYEQFLRFLLADGFLENDYSKCFLWIYSICVRPKPLKISRLGSASEFVFRFALCMLFLGRKYFYDTTLLSNTGPLFTIVLAFILYKTISKNIFFPLLFSLLGIFLIQRSDFYSGSSNFIGNLISLLSGFCIALVYMIAKNIRKNNSNVSYGRALFFYAAVTIGVICVAAGESIFSFESRDLKWFLFLGIVPSILGHNSLNYALKYLSPTAIASVPLGEPIIASLFGWFLFGEEITKSSLEGAPFVLIGIYFIIKRSSNNKL